MQIVFCSKNKAKTEAAEAVLKKKFGPFIDLIFHDSPSSVRATPFGSSECNEGAKNRIYHAGRTYGSASYIIGAEGGIITQNDRKFIGGFVAIRNRLGRMYFGESRLIEIPKSIAQMIVPNKQLFDAIDHSVFKKELLDDKDRLGLNGLITSGKYTRIDEFKDALNMALNQIVVE